MSCNSDLHIFIRMLWEMVCIIRQFEKLGFNKTASKVQKLEQQRLIFPNSAGIL